MRGVRRALGDLWRFRDLVRNLVSRNLHVKYQRSLLGFMWTLLNPVFTLSVLLVVFTRVVKIPIPSFWAFLISGYFVWLFLNHTLNYATLAIEEHGNLIRSAVVPTEAPLLAGCLSRLAEFSLELMLVLSVISLFHHGRVPASTLLLPLLVLMQLVLALGLAYAVATLSVFYQDMKHVLPIAMTALFYASPVFYSISLVPEPLRLLFWINPIALLLELYQTVLYEGVFPSPWLVLAVGVVSVLTYLGGHSLFNRFKVFFAEVV